MSNETNKPGTNEASDPGYRAGWLAGQEAMRERAVKACRERGARHAREALKVQYDAKADLEARNEEAGDCAATILALTPTEAGDDT